MPWYISVVYAYKLFAQLYVKQDAQWRLRCWLGMEQLAKHCALLASGLCAVCFAHAAENILRLTRLGLELIHLRGCYNSL